MVTEEMIIPIILMLIVYLISKTHIMNSLIFLNKSLLQ